MLIAVVDSNVNGESFVHDSCTVFVEKTCEFNSSFEFSAFRLYVVL